MSLNCLACQNMQRNNSGTEYDRETTSEKLCCLPVERSWSGNLGSPTYEKIGKSSMPIAKKIKKEHRRLNSTGILGFKGIDEPKLVRSSGMRRDWSFEDLKERDEERKERRR
ncbi:uncharacterized protein LOC105637409 [Jatropha curcas]|uniref:uncharacterized protein LOC105637409 n=1 Tax=Jatropha curcas TaxID=180498 RepID=UPI0005FAA662|nr:uncharacterized protein LOC105637409 [Jatropha curcas]